MKTISSVARQQETALIQLKKVAAVAHSKVSEDKVRQLDVEVTDLSTHLDKLIGDSNMVTEELLTLHDRDNEELQEVTELVVPQNPVYNAVIEPSG
jgi:hypothetical protein